MTTAADVRRRDEPDQQRALMQSGKLRCPHDKRLRHIEEYRALDRNAEFVDELAVILKCPDCGHFFAPVVSQAEMEKIVREARSE